MTRISPPPSVPAQRLEQTRNTATLDDDGTGSAVPFKVKAVVSSFISVGDVGTDSFRVAVFKRNRASHVYPGFWSSCAGSIDSKDAGPLAAALRELREETGLTPPTIELVKQGTGFDAVDQALRVKWHIHCFVFRLEIPEGSRKQPEEMVQLDEEHSEVRFVTLSEMDGLQTVDNLKVNLLKTLEE